MEQTLPPRREIKTAHTWDAASVYDTDDAWAADITRLEDNLTEIHAFRGRLGRDPQTLATYLQLAEESAVRALRIFTYAMMFHQVDTAEPRAAAMYDRARTLYGRFQAASAFAEPEMLTIGLDTLDRWADDVPRLSVYSHYFDTLRRRQEHLRSAEVEEVLGLAADAFMTASATHSTLTDADLTFAPATLEQDTTLELPVAQGTIGRLLTHPDRGVRRSAWENYADAHLAYKNTMATCLAAGVKQDVFRARVRRYESSLEASLAQSHIPPLVFHRTVETFRKHLPTWHRYWRVRRQALGYDRLHVYDIKAPLTANPPRVPFEQAVDWIAAGMAPLGDDYVQTLRRGALEQRWVDIYPNRGKRAGAFSSGVPGTHPFILMSYVDDVFSMSTLAHELGHSLHSYYSWETQPLVYAGYSLFVAEVASNFNQALVRAYLLDEHDDSDFQIAVIEEAMANFHRYFFIMPTLARFELEIHERVERGEPLNADSLIDLMAELFAEGYGDEVVMDKERVGITWAQFSSHLYDNFYVYQYTTGISGAHALAAGVLEGRPGAVDNYLAFLRAGGSLYPLDALKLAGVDMTSPEPVEQTFGVLAQLVDRLESLLVGR